MAHKKGVGSTKNGRDSESKRLGAKRADGLNDFVGGIAGLFNIDDALFVKICLGFSDRFFRILRGLGI